MWDERIAELRRVVADYRRDKYGTSVCLKCDKPLYGPELLHTPPKHWTEVYAKGENSRSWRKQVDAQP